MQGDVVRLGVRLAPLEMIEIAAARPRGGIVAGRKPGLGEMRLSDVVRRARPAHLGRHPAGVSAFDRTSGHRRATAKASRTSCSLLSA